MMRWLLWLVAVPHLYWLDQAFRSVGLDIVVSMDLSVVFIAALHARTTSIPGLLLFAAVARSLFGDANVALHFLALGLPVAVLLPLRSFFFGGSLAWQAAVSAMLAFAVPKVFVLFQRLSASETEWSAGDLLSVSVIGAAVSVPATAWALRQLPPLKWFVEESETR